MWERQSHWRYCGDCETPLTNHCPKCGAENPPSKRFCGDCGTALIVNTSAPSRASSSITPEIAISAEPASSVVPDGERKKVTALFADIKGSMELTEDLDPEEARAIVDPALGLMIETIQHYGGKLQQEGRAPIEIWVGINSGEVVARSIRTGPAQAEYTPIGHTSNLAARLQAVARTGSIVVSENTRRLTEGYFQFRSLGAVRIKGIAELINVHEVVGLGALRTRFQRAVGRGLTRFVGQARELETLKDALELAKPGTDSLSPQSVNRVGKSRLYYEFKAVSRGCMVLEAYSVSHGKVST